MLGGVQGPQGGVLGGCVALGDPPALICPVFFACYAKIIILRYSRNAEYLNNYRKVLTWGTPFGGSPQGPWSFPGVPWCPRVLEKISKIPKNYIKNIHAKKYPKLYSQHPFWGTWMPWGGLGGSKSSEGLRRGFFAPNRKVQKPNIVCIYPINNSPVVKIENFEISTLSPPLSK